MTFSKLLNILVVGTAAINTAFSPLPASYSPTVDRSTIPLQSVAAPLTQKWVVDARDTAVLEQMRARGDQLLADYGAFSLWRVTLDSGSSAAQSLTEHSGIVVRDDFDAILLRDGEIDTQLDAGHAQSAVAAALQQVRAEEAQLWLVQFVGPIKNEWVNALLTAGLTPVSYMPNNAYVVWGDGSALRNLDALAAQETFIQWSGPYHPAYRLAPSLHNVALGEVEKPDNSWVDVTVQFYRTGQVQASVERLLALTRQVYRPREDILNFTNLSLRLPVDQLSQVAGWPDVFNVEPWVARHKMDEVQGQIMAGNLVTLSGRVVPALPGYLAWLSSKGFPTTPASYPVVDIVDDGIDQGDAANVLHPDFYILGMTGNADRVVYIGNCTLDSSGDGQAGHGNLNAGIMGAYNNLSGFPYMDALGYHIGLGISPYGRIAGTKVFANSGQYSAVNCGNTDRGVVEAVYHAGADMTSNSWGADVFGSYDASAQAYDALTRDAVAATPGNQQMLHIFAAGNAGSSAQTIGSPGTAKNVLTVGATESVRDDGVPDGLCGERDGNNADDIASFSSRGPTGDQRVKPDIMAPGTHVQGPASQQANFDGSGVCGGPENNGFPPAVDAYYPAGQTLYTWSSGTSHSTPAVAGAASLLWEYYGRVFRPGQEPSPAMLKALIVNTPRYLAGEDNGRNRPTNNQGWGDVNLGMLFDGTPRNLLDQDVVFNESGQVYQTAGSIVDVSKPFHVSLVWTDAPGSTTGASYVNDLNLEVTVGGNVYRGNVFSGTASVAGGAFDARNNVENVFLPAGVSGGYQVRVVAANIAGNAVPGGPHTRAQDFALVIYNALDSGSIISGHVTDTATEQPLSGARVTFSSGPTQTFSALTNNSGLYSVRVPQGLYEATAIAYGYQPGHVSGLTVLSDTETTLDFALNAAASRVISGIVTDRETGMPLSATVSILGTPFNPPLSVTETDPATGHYSFTVAAGQIYTLTATGLLHASDVQSVVVNESDVTVNFVLSPTTTNGGLVGYVRDLYTSEPVSGALVLMQTPVILSDTTDADGYYEILGIPPGVYSATASAYLYTSATITPVHIFTSNLTSQTFLLPRSILNYAPEGLQKTVTLGTVVTQNAGLVISNTGAGILSFMLAERVRQVGTASALSRDALLVNCYSGSSTQAFEIALVRLGLSYDVTVSADFANMSIFDLLNYKVLLYACADPDVANSPAKLKLAEYLDAGGRLFTAEDDWGYFNAQSRFYQIYLDATYGGDSPGAENRALSGVDIMQGVNTPSEDPYPDHFTPGGNSLCIFHYVDGRCGGSRIQRDNYRAVYVATDLNFLGTSQAGEAIEAVVLDRGLRWLLGRFDVLGWLSESTITGTLAMSEATDIDLAWDATPAAGVTQPGIFLGNLWLTSNDPLARSVLLPVTMTVQPATNQGLLTGVVTTMGICDVTPAPLVGVGMFIQAADGFSVTLQTDTQGTYSYYLQEGVYTATVSAHEHPTTTLTVVISGGMTTTQDFVLRLQRSCVQLEPDALTVQLAHGARVSQTVVITSSGALPLNANVLELSAHGPVSATDAFGYRLRPDTPYNFIDISATGQFANPNDDEEFNITLPFPMSFYGVESTQLRVGNNGAILFNTTQGDVYPSNSSMQNAPEFFMAPFWDDLSSENGAVYLQALGVAPNRTMVVLWKDRPHYGGIGGTVTFEVVLHENGNILFQYQDVEFGDDVFNRGNSATVGIRGQGITNSLEYSFNSSSLRNEFAICFQHPAVMSCDDAGDEVPWLTVTPTEVTELAGSPPGSQTLVVAFDSSQTPGAGVYSASLLLRNDSPIAEVLIPVTMVVTDTHYLPLIMR